MERILQRSAGKSLRRTWIEHPYGEEEIALLEEEVLPAIKQCLARVDELDQRLLAEQAMLQRCEIKGLEIGQQNENASATSSSLS